MSMRAYATDDYGLVLDEKAMKEICRRKFSDEFTEEEFASDELAWMVDAADSLDITAIGDLTGEAFELTGDGETLWGTSKPIGCGTAFLVGLSKYPRLCDRAYQSMDEAIDEIKRKIGQYLPDDFDYEGNMKHIIGTYYG